MKKLFKQTNKACPQRLKRSFCRRGFTYIELIVVLSIFAVMSSIVLFDYGGFQAKIDIKNLASNIALKIVTAQKSSLSGSLPPPQYAPSNLLTWKPSYGVYFSKSTSKDTSGGDNKDFIYFTDLDNTTPPENGVLDIGESLDTISITGENYISGINKCSDDVCSSPSSIAYLSITFQRPYSGVIFKQTAGASLPIIGSQYIQISIASSRSSDTTANIDIYPSGRIQVK